MARTFHINGDLLKAFCKTCDNIGLYPELILEGLLRWYSERPGRIVVWMADALQAEEEGEKDGAGEVDRIHPLPSLTVTDPDKQLAAAIRFSRKWQEPVRITYKGTEGILMNFVHYLSLCSQREQQWIEEEDEAAEEDSEDAPNPDL